MQNKILNLTGIMLVVAVAAAITSGCATTAASNPTVEPPPKQQPVEKSVIEMTHEADASWQDGKLDRAIYLYLLVLEKSPKDETAFAKIGAIEEGRGNLERARKAFEMAHAIQPEEPRIAERLGRLYLRNGNSDAAAEMFAHVLSTNSGRARSLDGMGEVLRIRKNYAESIEYFDRALVAEDADLAEVLTHRGYSKMLAGSLNSAMSDLRVALRAKSIPDGWLHLAELQTRQGDNASALKSLLNIMDVPHAYNQIGTVLLNMRNYREAIECFSQAITANPTWYQEAHQNLALAQEYLKRAAG